MRSSHVSPVLDRALPPGTAARSASLDQHLAWWRDAGLITPEQARAIAEQERRWAGLDDHRPSEQVGPSSRRLPSVVEVLGYIGGVLSAVGAVLLLSRYWDDMGSGVRLAIGAGVSVVLMVAGVLVHEDADPALRRLRWSLWTLSSGAAAATTAFVVRDAFDVHDARSVALAVASVVALQNGVLWADRVRPVQQALFLVALPVVVGTGAGHVVGTTSTALLVALTGAVMLATGLAGRTVVPALTDGIGAFTLALGVAMVSEEWTGPALLAVMGVTAFLLWLSIAAPFVRHESERVVLAVVGIVTLVQMLPQTLAWYSDQAGIATGLVVVALGVGLMGVARRRAVAVPVLVLLVGGAAVVGGLALTARQSVAFATVSGLSAAVALLVLGTRHGWAAMSLFGSAALLVNVPWAIWWFFPGEDRAPLLTTVSGVLIIVVAVLLARVRGRLRDELTGEDQPSSVGGSTDPVVRA